MENFTLTNFLTIKGISAASGLLFSQNVLFVISDSSSFLYQYDLEKSLLLKFPLVKEPAENIRKQDKLDLESITRNGNQLLLLGSGSTAKRTTLFSLDLSNDVLKTQDLQPLYQKLKTVSELTDAQFNIEGAIYANETMVLFQRGNSKDSQNGIFLVPNNQKDNIRFIPIILPTLDGIETTFTDAILVNDTIYFLACAENTSSTYEDGDVLGSILGIMHAPTFEIIAVKLLSDYQKFEGITLYKNSDETIEFLLCEDNDTELSESIIYKLTLEKNEH